jgi:NitT/TauT family transport system substrate-binding protein
VKRAALLAAGASIAAARAVCAQELTSLRITCVPNDDVSPLLYAREAGLFRRAGLEIQVYPSTSGAVIAAAVAGGSYDIGLASMMALVTGHARGLPFMMIAPSLLYQAGSPAGLQLVPKDSPIQNGRDLAGKLLSVAAIRDINWVSTRVWLDSLGVDSSTVRFVELPQSAVLAALDQKRIDSAFVLIPTLDTALASGKYRSIGDPLAAVARRWMVAAWFTTGAYATKNRDVVLRFSQVMHAATVYANNHFAETAPLIASFVGVDTAAVLQMKRVSCAEYLDGRDFQPAIDAAAKYGVIERGFNAQELISADALRPPR